jgi:hypothetical protein
VPPFPCFVGLSAEGTKQILDDICVFDHMVESTFLQDNTEMFSFFSWMANPDPLPRSKTVTFFPEQEGRAHVSHGPPRADVFIAPLEGRGLVLLIHLDQYTNLLPQPDRTLSSWVSWLPPSSSDGSAQPFRVYKKFQWAPGVVDSPPDGQQASQRCGQACQMMSAGDRRNDNQDDNDGCDDNMSRCDWCRNINARG